MKYQQQDNFQALRKQSGVILLIMLSVLVLALTSVVIAKVSLNKLKSRNMHEDGKVLQQAQEALLAYSVVNAVPGTLPCPDNDTPQDGLENRVGTNCSAPIGRLPYRSLGIDNLNDSSGNSLWYAVAPAYTESSTAIARNSSIANNFLIDGQAVSALAIAPGGALQGQQRSPVTVAGFLEGENANASVDVYAQVRDDNNNDLLIGLRVQEFWELNQIKILDDIGGLLNDYKSACGEFPWAASFIIGPDDSINALQVGSFPLDTALPVDWNTGCALGIEPSNNLRDHWRDQIYFQFCRVSEGSCLQLTGDLNQMVDAVVIAPGNIILAQDRSSYALSEYFEDENASGSSPYKFLNLKNHSVNFNDSVYVVSP